MEKIAQNTFDKIVTLTTASGHSFTYSYNVRTIANALVKLEQSQLHAERKAAIGAVEPTDGPQSRTSAANGQIDQ